MTLAAGYSAVQTFGSVGTRRWAVTPHKMSPVYGYSGYLGLDEYVQPAGSVGQSVAYLTLAENVPSPLSNCPEGMHQPVISPRIWFCGASYPPLACA